MFVFCLHTSIRIFHKFYRKRPSSAMAIALKLRQLQVRARAPISSSVNNVTLVPPTDPQYFTANTHRLAILLSDSSKPYTTAPERSKLVFLSLLGISIPSFLVTHPTMCHALRILHQTCGHCMIISEATCTTKCPDMYSFTAVKDTNEAEIDVVKRLENSEDAFWGTVNDHNREPWIVSPGSDSGSDVVDDELTEQPTGLKEVYVPTWVREQEKKKNNEWLDVQPTKVEMDKDMMKEDKKIAKRVKKTGGWIVLDWADKNEGRKNATMVPYGDNEESRQWDTLEDFVVV
ncbi:hypothetical protein BZA77DRAFT_343620 [Pyronema omphalodes]|nr:hypothetical protein BZA77DRAFT_343620 [Pyronema omphalodes]